MSKMKECTVKELIDKLNSIYNEYGDIKVLKDDECGGMLSLYSELIRVADYYDKEGNVVKYVEM